MSISFNGVIGTLRAAARDVRDTSSSQQRMPTYARTQLADAVAKINRAADALESGGCLPGAGTASADLRRLLDSSEGFASDYQRQEIRRITDALEAGAAVAGDPDPAPGPESQTIKAAIVSGDLSGMLRAAVAHYGIDGVIDRLKAAAESLKAGRPLEATPADRYGAIVCPRCNGAHSETECPAPVVPSPGALVETDGPGSSWERISGDRGDERDQT